ncbi:MAG: hypothetical protein E6J87_19455 [Deltaproteobacteria bacterium]|nr:MAG: hypothetical protein E6J87_19455 [Deltaproteobacteria bacterium]
MVTESRSRLAHAGSATHRNRVIAGGRAPDAAVATAGASGSAAPAADENPHSEHETTNTAKPAAQLQPC